MSLPRSRYTTVVRHVRRLPRRSLGDGGCDVRRAGATCGVRRAKSGGRQPPRSLINPIPAESERAAAFLAGGPVACARYGRAVVRILVSNGASPRTASAHEQ
jgi:hypothetical protein